MGYPVILKATAGGGGRGMRIVKEDSEFKKAWDDAKMESEAAFGNDGLYLEKFVEEPRHIEIQIVGTILEKLVTFPKEIVPSKEGTRS